MNNILSCVALASFGYCTCIADDNSVVSRMNDIEENARLLNGKFEDIQHAINTLKTATKGLEEKIALIEEHVKQSQCEQTKNEPSLKSGKDVIAAAKDMMKNNQLDSALETLSDFLSQNKSDIYRGQAYYFIGVIYQKKGKYNEALVAYKNAYKENPNGNKAADALFGVGSCINVVNGRDAAMVVLKKLQSTFPQRKKLADSLKAEIEKRDGRNRKSV